jgi:hypothetical protein
LSRTREKALNDAIASADSNVGFEPFACAYIEFYHGDAQLKIEDRELQGSKRFFSALISLLTLLDLEKDWHVQPVAAPAPAGGACELQARQLDTSACL